MAFGNRHTRGGSIAFHRYYCLKIADQMVERNPTIEASNEATAHGSHEPSSNEPTAGGPHGSSTTAAGPKGTHHSAVV
jgi:hypothetical protein